MRLTSETTLQIVRPNKVKAQRLLQLQTPPNLGFGDEKLFIEPGIYEGFVGWNKEAMMDYGLALDETSRLARLLSDASGALCFGGGCFVTRAVHTAQITNEQRHVLSLKYKSVQVAGERLKAWVIEP